MDKEYQYNFEVRDYECDLTGVVNNANYFHYFEHARHKFLNEFGISYADFHQNKGITLVLIQAKIDFIKSLKNDNQFCVRLSLHQESRLKFYFQEQIYLMPSEELIAQGKFTCVAFFTKTKKPFLPPEIKSIIDLFKEQGLV
ncbi:MAG: acyl-CoA thioesterase [bacterium]|nr:acyl-CoA thioesterase [bacterium]